MDYDALVRSPLRCWGHDDCLEHPELGVACGERPLEMCVSDEQRFAMEPLFQHLMPTGSGDQPYQPWDTESDWGGDGGVVEPDSDGLDCDIDDDHRNNQCNGGRYRQGDGGGDGDRWSRQLEGETDLLADDYAIPAPLSDEERAALREGGW